MKVLKAMRMIWVNPFYLTTLSAFIFFYIGFIAGRIQHGMDMAIMFYLSLFSLVCFLAGVTVDTYEGCYDIKLRDIGVIGASLIWLFFIVFPKL